MSFRHGLMLILAASLLMLPILSGCGGASLDSGKNRNLEQVEPDFTNPIWYQDFEQDRAAAYKRFKGKVIEIDVMVVEVEESPGGTTVLGTTGDMDRYRASCIFPPSAGTSMERVRAGREITVKGLFDHMQETSTTFQIYLKNCVLVAS